jgi:hypothetical protein
MCCGLVFVPIGASRVVPGFVAVPVMPGPAFFLKHQVKIHHSLFADTIPAA